MKFSLSMLQNAFRERMSGTTGNILEKAASVKGSPTKSNESKFDQYQLEFFIEEAIRSISTSCKAIEAFCCVLWVFGWAMLLLIILLLIPLLIKIRAA